MSPAVIVRGKAEEKKKTEKGRESRKSQVKVLIVNRPVAHHNRRRVKKKCRKVSTKIRTQFALNWETDSEILMYIKIVFFNGSFMWRRVQRNALIEGEGREGVGVESD